MHEPTEPPPERRPEPGPSVARAATSISIATICSRLLGVAREIVMAKFFGAGRATDAFNVAYRIPNLFRDLFAEGALSSAFVPTFVRELGDGGRERAWRLANLVMNALVVLLGLVTIAIYFGARGFVYLLAADFARQPDKLELTVQMTRIISPFLLFVALAAVAMGMLNALGSFFLPAMASSAYNVCVILAGVLLSPLMPRFGLEPVVSMAIGASIGGASQFLVQLPAAYRRGFRYRFVLDLQDPALRRIGRLMLPAVVGLSATQINITVDNQIAATYPDGAISYLNYAFRLMQLPIGVFGVALATATLASVSRHAAEGAIDRLRATIASSLRLAACLTFPATVGLMLFRVQIVQLLYEHGKFTPTDTLQTSDVVLLYAIALFGYSAVKILVPAFYALGDTRTPVRTSVITVAVKVAINFALIVPLGFKGLALATAAASWLNFGMLLRGLNRRTGPIAGPGELAVYARIGAAAVGIGFVGLAAFHLAALVVPVRGTATLALDLGLGIAASIASTLPLMQLLRIPEAAELGRVMSRLAGKLR